jgi:hypothetical protein
LKELYQLVGWVKPESQLNNNQAVEFLQPNLQKATKSQFLMMSIELDLIEPLNLLKL